MQPSTPIPLNYRRALRWLSWKAGNNYVVLADRPDCFYAAYRIWNQTIDPASVFSTARAAEQAAIACLDGEIERPSQHSNQFGDFRDGVCDVAYRLAKREFAIDRIPGTKKDTEFWSIGGSELEMIFAIYMNNVSVTSELTASNHDYAMSRLELYFETYSRSNPLEQWECDHDPVA